MREIKFRVWDGNNKKYDYPEILELHKGIEYEQFTGLHDKNGKEIYEVDICKIVRWKNSNDESFIIGDIFEKVAAFHVRNGDALCSTNLIGHINPDIIEVIGNIHENPELLK